MKEQIEHGLGEHEEMREALGRAIEMIGQLGKRCAALEERLEQRDTALSEVFDAGKESQLRDLGLPPQRERKRRDRRLMNVIPGIAFIAAAAAWAMKAATWPSARHAARAAGYAIGAARRHATTAAVAGAVTAGAAGTLLITTRTVVLVPGAPSSPSATAPGRAGPSLEPGAAAPPAVTPSQSWRATPDPSPRGTPSGTPQLAVPADTVTAALPAGAAGGPPAPAPSVQLLVPSVSPAPSVLKHGPGPGNGHKTGTSIGVPQPAMPAVSASPVPGISTTLPWP
jgi:hypothetical protein